MIKEVKPLRDWVLASHMTVQDFADLVGVSPQAVYRWYAGGKISRRKLHVICTILGKTRDQIL